MAATSRPGGHAKEGNVGFPTRTHVTGEQLQLRLESQQNAIADEVSALVAVIRPILLGTLFALKKKIVEQLDGHEKITLEMLARVYRAGDRSSTQHSTVRLAA